MRLLAAACLALSSVLSIAAAAAGPPPTPAEPFSETLHGVEIADEYRWLEGGVPGGAANGEDAALATRVAQWTDSQNAYTRGVLDALPGRAALEARLRELLEVGEVSAPAVRRNRHFYKQRAGRQAQPVVYLREGHDGAPRQLVDPNALDASGLTALPWFEPSPDGTLLAFGLYAKGDENATLHLLDVDSGAWLADEIPGKVNEVSWLPDGRSFVYSRLADVLNPYSRQVKFHRVGQHHRQDPVLFAQLTEGPLATTWGPFGYTSRDGRWLVLGYWTGTDSNDLWVCDFDRWQRTGELQKTAVVAGEKAISSGPVGGDVLYLQTTLGAPAGRVVAVDLNAPGRAGWREIVPERPEAVIQSVLLARGMLVVEYLKDATSRVERFSLSGAPLGELPLPGLGTAALAVEEDRTEAFLTFESFNEPESIYRVDLAGGGERALWERPAVPVDPALVQVEQVFYTSKDGARVPMFLVHKKGLRRDGSNPTLLNGYGGFNISETPFFRATLFPWFEAGGVYALPGLRGGGEYGEAWHRAGMLERKQNVFDDFIAAAEWLVANRYTRPQKLAISGGSNGGLLTGAALVQRPELFGAVISAVPLLDMLRYQHFLMARYWVPEYGSSEDPAQFQFLRAYSPYHGVDPGTAYPAVLLTAGENDARVHPLHARKMTARLRAATASDQEAKPILLWVDRSAGHGQGKPLELRLRDVVDQRLFVMWQLGMLGAGG